ncbi:hypothetical protein [Streptomyces sp. NBC_00299]|uniref:hypothetical protein n=1 Tax=Streptomyces sp. NBC_00299 TaxID=2975705 RepID=UPI002E2E6A75|nr:hypothetical protein [Streptomyces sp. NBC_00299]
MALVPRNISQAEAREVIDAFVAERLIKLESPSSTTGRINLDGWNPVTLENEPGNVAGVIVRYWPTGKKGTESQISTGSAPDRLDPRNAMAFVLMCQMLNTAWGVTELYHAGISGDRPGGRNDCHGQGRAVDFVGARGNLFGADVYFTVFDDWGRIHVPGLTTAGGDWPAGTGGNTSYRLLADGAPDTAAWQFFLELYHFAATNYQDRTDGLEDASDPTDIGKKSRFIMHPDHPKSAPGTLHGREAHKGHIHMQIGRTGSA